MRSGIAVGLGLLLSAASAVAEVHTVRTQTEYREIVETLVPGDTVQLANGEWADFEILFTGEGTAAEPITLTAEEKGKVFITGQSNLQFSGEYLTVSGLVFKNGYSPTNTVLSFRSSKDELANHSRVTEVVIDKFNNPERRETDFWVMMYGKNNQFDHNHLVGKSNTGVTMAVRLNSVESQQNNHRIQNNYFGPRPILGSNGGETLRIGTSHHSRTESGTLVENNYFERCDGEVEIISSKSGGNVFRGNVFFESRGTLTLRHGHGNLVESNVFIGNRVPHTGGIRVINERQTIRNNYLSGLTGHRFGGALVVMNGVPNSPQNRYDPVVGALIENNSVINSDHVEFGAGSDEERSSPPTESMFKSNLIVNDKSRDVIAILDDVSGIEFVDNAVGKKTGLTNANESFAPVNLSSGKHVRLTRGENGLMYPSARSLKDSGVSRELVVLNRADTGVSWYAKADLSERLDAGNTIAVTSEAGALSAAVRAAASGDIIELAPGDYLVARTIQVDRALTVRSQDESNPAAIEFERTALFEIRDGGSLKLQGLNISGRSAPDVAGNSVIRTSRYSMLNNYTLIVLDSQVRDLDVNHSFNFFSPAKHTFADLIKIAGSSFSNITGHVLPLNKEQDDLGIYGAEFVIVEGSSFEEIGGSVVDLYRGGTDESTFGPHFYLSDSQLESVGADKRNKSKASLKLLGVQDTRISGTTLTTSQPLKMTQTVGDPMTWLSKNKYVQSPQPVYLQPGER